MSLRYLTWIWCLSCWVCLAMPASFPSGMEMFILYTRDPWCDLIGSHSVEIALTVFVLLKTKDAINIRMNAFHL